MNMTYSTLIGVKLKLV